MIWIQKWRTLCFGAMSYASVRPDYDRENGLADNPVWTKLSDVLVRNPLDCKAETRGDYPYFFTPEQRESVLIFVTRSQGNGGAVRNEDQKR